MRTAAPPVMVMVRLLCWHDCWWCWCFRWWGCWRWWLWVRVSGWRGCGRWPVLGGFLCCFNVGKGVLGVVLVAGVAGGADDEGALVDVLVVLALGVSVGSGSFRW